MNLKGKVLVVVSALVVMLGVPHLMNGAAHPTSNQDLAKVTVMVTNMEANSGGSGVIVHSTYNESTVLTNAHVCRVVEHGGLVTGAHTQGSVTKYQVSTMHDLCLITTNVNMGANTEVAKESPGSYTQATVTGHPLLLPTVITRGNFSDKQIIAVMTKMRACTDDDFKGPNAGICMFVGAVPVIKLYQSQVTSATIQPGSSGSAVFNDSGYISGLIFAGSGPLSYGHMVPVEYVSNFVNNEVNKLEFQYPKDADVADTEERENLQKLTRICRNEMSLEFEVIKEYCKYVNSDMVYTQ